MSLRPSRRGLVRRPRLLPIRKPYRPGIEVMEDRLMLDGAAGTVVAALPLSILSATPASVLSKLPVTSALTTATIHSNEIVVGRTPSTFTVAGVTGHQLSITYTAYNEQADPETGVLLTTTLQPGVTFVSSTSGVDRNGQQLALSLGTINGFDRASVTITVSVAATIPLQLDTGAAVYATLDAGAISNVTTPATLRAGSVDASLLASTPDANWTDPFVQEQAAKLDYDAQKIFDFLHTQIGYNSYTGSLRGARGTLWSSAGNALDVSSLGVALYRGSGIPAQYVQGTLTTSQAQTLILSMFPPSYQTVGYIPAGTKTSDPANDPKLLSETKSHYWFQFDAGSGMKDADPLMGGATVGRSFTPSAVTFTEVPDALREKTTIKLNAEITTPSLFGGSFQTVTTVLTQTFNDVDLVGRPLSIGHFVNTSTTGFIFSATTNTYSPFLDMGDEAFPISQDQVIRGKDFQEVLTNFPFGSQIVTGLFLNVDLSGPAGATQTYERTLADRIGYAARQGLQQPSLSIKPGDPPLLSEFDVFTLSVGSGRSNPKTSDVFSNAAHGVLQRIGDPQFLSLPQDQQFATLQHQLRDGLIATTRQIAGSFTSLSDGLTDQIAGRSLVKAYFDRPRLILVSTRAPNGTIQDPGSFAIDLRRDSMRALAFPGQAVSAVPAFATVRGIAESVLEHDTLELLVSPPSTSGTGSTGQGFFADLPTVFTAAQSQGIPPLLITPENQGALQGLGISNEAKARITAALGLGKDVIVPTSMVNLGGSPRIAWYEIDSNTGEAVGVGENGGHPTLFEWGGLAQASPAIFGILVVGAVVPCIIKASSLVDFNADVANRGFDLAFATALKNFANCAAMVPSEAQKFLVEAAKWAFTTAVWLVGLFVDRLKHPGASTHAFAGGGPAGGADFSSILNTVDTLTGYITTSTSPRPSANPSSSSAVPDKGLIGSILNRLSAGVPGINPSAAPLSAPASAGVANGQGQRRMTVAASVAGGAVTGSSQQQSLSVSSTITSSWTSTSSTSFLATSLNAVGASVTDANGNNLGSGTVVLTASSAVPLTLGGSVSYQLTGKGSLSFYVAISGGLGVSADWNQFNASVSGDSTIQLTTNGLSLNGSPLAAGTYSIRSAAATLSGSGLSASPNFAGLISMNATGGNLDLGPGLGSVTVGGAPLDLSTGASLTGYSGTINVTANGMTSDTVTLNGNAGDILSISGGPPTISTDQNTPVTFQANVQTSFADTYYLTANAPVGWMVTIDASGKVTATPAPGLQGGTYPIQVIARSTKSPDLVAQSVVNVTITPTQPGLAFTVAPDPIFTVSYNGAQLPTAFRATIQNLGPAADTYKLTFANIPSGFTLFNSNTSDTVPAGQTGVVGVYLQPNIGQPIPPPGTILTFNITATSTTNSAITKTQIVTLTVPAIDALTLTGNPTSLNTTTGTPVTETLTITNAGNVPENNVTLTSSLPTGLTLTGLTPVSLQPGQSMTETVTVTPAASTPLNSHLTTTITATFGPSSSTQTLTIPVGVVVPGADAIANASDAANQIGDGGLAARLGDLSTALTNLVQSPTNPVFKSQALASLDSVIAQVGSDPNLASLAGIITATRGPLDAATTAAVVQTAVSSLGAVLDNLSGLLSDLAKHRFQLSFVTNSQVAQPNTPATFTLVLRNLGNTPTTYVLSLEGLSPGLTGQFNQGQITLAPGAVSTAITVTLTPDATADITALSFRVRATAQEAAGVTATATGSFTARAEFVSVISVTTDPTFINAGGQVHVSARVLNAVNREQTARATFVVHDAANQVVFTSQPVNVTLGVLTSITTVALGTLDTTGFALGNDTIQVTLTTMDGTPLPGGSGQGTLLIGSPVSGSLSVDRDLLPPGTSTVTDTLTVQATASLVGPLGVISQTDVPGGAGMVLNGHLVYESGTSGINVYDVTNPASPLLLHTAGTRVDILKIRGDKLYGLSRGGGANGITVSVYSLADPTNPQLLGTTPGIPYSVGQHMLVTDTHVFISIWSITYLLGNNDITYQTGDLLSVDVSNPASPHLDGVLLNTYGTNNDGIGQFQNVDNSGGDGNLWELVQVDANTLLVAGSTAKGTDTQTGSGVVHVVDISDPKHMSIIRTLVIPGTLAAVGLSVAGNRAFATGSTMGWGDFTTRDFLGNTVLATLDISDPRNPVLLHSETLNRPSIGPYSQYTTSLGNGLFGFSSGNGSPSDPAALFLVDANNPTNLGTSNTSIPAGVANIDGQGNFVYTSSPSGLIVYQINATAAIPATARVDIPKNTGVTIVPGSFSLQPSQIIADANFDTYVWNLNLTSAARTITWQSIVTNLKPGQTLPIALNGSVSFTSQGTAGAFALPSLEVSGLHLLGLDPGSRTAQPGASASYTLKVANPTNAAVTYALAMMGVPASWSNVEASVTVPANGSVDVPFTLTSDSLSALASYGFTITARAGTRAIDQVQGTLTLEGASVFANTDAHGIVATLTPGQASAGQGTSARYVVRITNTGSALETFDLSASGLPPGVSITFAESFIDVPPGVSNFRDVAFTLTPAPGTLPGNLAFTVTARSKAQPTVTGSVSGTLTVAANGVGLTLSPNNATPGSSLLLTVKNTGTITDTFDVALAGPAALVSTLSTIQVTLAPGASQAVPIMTTAVNFAVQGDLTLMVIATSRGNSKVNNHAASALTIPSTQGMSTSLSPVATTLAKPGLTTLLLNVNNTGNAEDSYTATITGTTGPVTANLLGLDGLPTQTIPIFRLPGLSQGAILVQADLSAIGNGTITVQVTSLSSGRLTSTAVASLATAGSSNGDGPKVVGLSRYGIHWMPTTVVLTFDQPLDPSTATNVNNYILIDPRGHRIAIALAEYDAAKKTVTLHPSRSLNFHRQFKLTVLGATAGGIANPQGALLDGNGNGLPGSDYKTVITRKNLVYGKKVPVAAHRIMTHAAHAATVAPSRSVAHRPPAPNSLRIPTKK